MISSILEPISNDLKYLETKLTEYLMTPNTPTNQVIEHVFSTGGKRIRPALFLLSSKLIGYDGEHKFPIASVCEYIHTASLLHDDVIDNSTLRRNKPTVNSVWGDETAVLTGDLIYSAACRLMVKTLSLKLIDDFAECIRFMSESELFQLELLWKQDVSLEQYNRVVAGKTAMLFEVSAKSPCYLRETNPDITKLLAEYGKNIGFAFQIFDDYLDYTGIQSQVGKPLTTDLTEGKVTLPLILAMQSKHHCVKKLEILVSKILENGTATQEEQKELIQYVKETNSLDSSLKIAEKHIIKAKENLQKIPQILKLSKEQNLALNALIEISSFVLNRKN